MRAIGTPQRRVSFLLHTADQHEEARSVQIRSVTSPAVLTQTPTLYPLNGVLFLHFLSKNGPKSSNFIFKISSSKPTHMMGPNKRQIRPYPVSWNSFQFFQGPSKTFQFSLPCSMSTMDAMTLFKSGFCPVLNFDPKSPSTPKTLQNFAKTTTQSSLVKWHQMC